MGTIEQQFKDEAYYTKAIVTTLWISFVGMLVTLSYWILKPLIVRLEEGLNDSNEKDLTVVDMKNDWKVIYHFEINK